MIASEKASALLQEPSDDRAFKDIALIKKQSICLCCPDAVVPL